MTCIVGLKHDGKVYIGGDSCGSNSYEYEIREDKKVFINGNMIFGFTSSFRMGNLLQYKLEIPDHDPRIDDFKYMCTDFIDEVIKCLKDNGYASINNNEVLGGFFLVGYKGRLYEIESDFQVAESILPYRSVGCGKYFSMGALHQIFKDNRLKDPNKIITNALDSATAFSVGVKPPYTILSI